MISNLNTPWLSPGRQKIMRTISLSLPFRYLLFLRVCKLLKMVMARIELATSDCQLSTRFNGINNLRDSNTDFPPFSAFFHLNQQTNRQAIGKRMRIVCIQSGGRLPKKDLWGTGLLFAARPFSELDAKAHNSSCWMHLMVHNVP
jgi:hypothetical protein